MTDLGGSLGETLAPVVHGGLLLEPEAPRLEGLLVETGALAFPLQVAIALQETLGLLRAVFHLFRRHALLLGCSPPQLHPRKHENSAESAAHARDVGFIHMGLKLGLNLGYWGIGPQGDEATDIVLAAERAGFDSVWAAES